VDAVSSYRSIYTSSALMPEIPSSSWYTVIMVVLRGQEYEIRRLNTQSIASMLTWNTGVRSNTLESKICHLQLEAEAPHTRYVFLHKRFAFFSGLGPIEFEKAVIPCRFSLRTSTTTVGEENCR
jgi:hypothetical protein